MKRSRLALGALVVLLVVAVAVSRVAGGALTRGGPPEVRGQFTDVQSLDIGHCRSFTLHAVDGRTMQFACDPSVDMTPGHMREHMTFGQPVTVRYRRAGDILVATQVSD